MDSIQTPRRSQITIAHAMSGLSADKAHPSKIGMQNERL
jgi:hypothetical protein